jgi:V8-like Glu-specific endopeptidase
MRARFILKLYSVGKVVINHSWGKLKELKLVSGFELIRHTAKTEPGNSGSPLLDEGLNEVLGLHHAGEMKGSYSFSTDV